MLNSHFAMWKMQASTGLKRKQTYDCLQDPPLRAFCHDPVSFAAVLIVYIQTQFHKENIFSNRKGNISNMLSYETFIKIKDESKCVLF